MDDFERTRELLEQLAAERRAATPRVDGSEVARVARELSSAAKPSTPKRPPAAGRRGRRPNAAGAQRALVGARLGPAKGVRPDGRRVSVAEKRALVAQFAPPGGWRSPIDPARAPANHVTPLGW
jgi:hypothetical protein